MSWANLLNWFAGGDRPYHTLFHCMHNDTFWVWLTVSLDVLVATGYAVIARHWWVNQRALPGNSQAKRALAAIRNIFIFCGTCGYLFIPVKMFWPAWRLYDVVMAFLVYFTWKYAFSTKSLRVVYAAIGRSEQLQQELEASRAEARRKAFFLNAISHDLRTPLNGLMLQAELATMAVESQDPAMLRGALGEIKSAAQATADLLNGFLEIGRLDVADGDDRRFADVAIGEALRAVVNMHAPAAGKAGLWLRVGLDSADAGVTVRTDRGMLDRILQNLVSNAVKFTTHGGVEVSATVRGTDVDVAVRDTGPGIAPEHLGRLFEEFFQANNYERDRRKGFGLGLAIARRLAHRLGGDIDVVSRVGAGSTFTLRLPGAVVERPTATVDAGRSDGALPAHAGAGSHSPVACPA